MTRGDRSSDSPAGRLRVDKWLWVARFFKTRSLASDAIARNQIRVDGQRVKPSRTVGAGDRLRIEKPPFEFHVTVLGVAQTRRPASEARLLYRESDDSVAARETMSERLRMERLARLGVSSHGRPTKKQRRQIIRFQNVHDAPDSSDD